MFRNKMIALFTALVMLFASTSSAWAVRTSITVKPVPNFRDGITTNEGLLTMTAADASNSNEFVFTGNEILVIQNTSASTQRTFTLTSAPDGLGRTADVTAQTIEAGEIKIFQFESDGWEQSTGKIYFAGSHAEVKFGVIRPRK